MLEIPARVWSCNVEEVERELSAFEACEADGNSRRVGKVNADRL